MPDQSARTRWSILMPLIALMIVVAGTLVFLSRNLPETTMPAQHLAVSEFTVVMGSGAVKGERYVIDGFADGYALLSSGAVNIPADGYRYLSLGLDRQGSTDIPTLFWRRSDAPEELVQLNLQGSGDITLDLSYEAGWRGEISELGFLLRGDGDGRVVIGGVKLDPDTLALRAREMWRDWSAFEGWTQKSVNFLHGGAAYQLVRLPLPIIAWLLLALVLAGVHWRWSRTSEPREFLMTGVLLFLAAWMIMDTRWTTNRMAQLRQTAETFWSRDDEQKLVQSLDGEIYRYVQRLKQEVLPGQASRILILGDEHAIDYFLQRAKYHLLPHSAHAAQAIPGNLIFESLDYVVFFGEPEQISKVRGFRQEWMSIISIVDRDERGIVFRLEARAAPF